MITTTVDKVPIIFREKGIFTGYRLDHRPWLYYIKSVIYPHNETLNIWTHFIGALLLIWQMWNLYNEFHLHAELQPCLIIALLFTISSVGLQLISSTAHMLHSHSEAVHCFLFFCDNSAASLIAFTVHCIIFCFTASHQFYDALHEYFLPLQIIGALLSSFSYSYALAKYRRNYNKWTSLLMFGTTGIYILMGNAPFLYKVILRFYFHDQSQESEDLQLHHLCYVAIFLFGVLFYVSYCPEIIWPGKFDIYGHSHQWFHVFTSMAHFVTLKAIQRDMRGNHYLLYSKRAHLLTVDDVAGAMAIIIINNFAIVLLLKHLFDYETMENKTAADDAICSE